MTLFKFRVAICRIRLFATLISKIKPLKSYQRAPDRPKKKKSVKVSVKSKFLKLGLDNTIINSNGHNISRDKTMFTMSFYQSRFSRPAKKFNKSGSARHFKRFFINSKLPIAEGDHSDAIREIICFIDRHFYQIGLPVFKSSLQAK